MSKARVWLPVIALALTTLSVLAYFGYLAQRAPSTRTASRGPTLTLPAAPAPPPSPQTAEAPPPRQVVTAVAPSPFDEAQLMAELREQRSRDPQAVLQRATEANALHPDSPGAAERAYLVVRSLEDLRRFHEAQDAARVMQQRYPGTAWTEDVERHVLLHPLSLPSREEQQASLPSNSGN
jgi:hypothetical protein